MKIVYIAGPLFDDHERSYLEEIAEILENYSYETFLPHRDAGLVTGEFTFEKKSKVFDVDMEYLAPADLVVALLTGRDVDSGTAAEIGYAIQKEKDDAKAKEMFNMYSQQANEEVANYLALEGCNAVKKVGETDDGKPIYAYDQSVGQLSSIKENIAATAENNTQRDIFNLKAEASLVTDTDKMTRHSLIEQNKYADTEDLLSLDNLVVFVSLPL